MTRSTPIDFAPWMVGFYLGLFTGWGEYAVALWGGAGVCFGVALGKRAAAIARERDRPP